MGRLLDEITGMAELKRKIRKAKITAIILLSFMVICIIFAPLLIFMGQEEDGEAIKRDVDGEARSYSNDLPGWIAFLIDKDSELKNKISAHSGSTPKMKGADGEKLASYENIQENYYASDGTVSSLRSNAKEILAMMMVYFAQDYEDGSAIFEYMDQLYNASHHTTYYESSLYACELGCTERSYACSDDPGQAYGNCLAIGGEKEKRISKYQYFAVHNGCEDYQMPRSFFCTDTITDDSSGYHIYMYQRYAAQGGCLRKHGISYGSPANGCASYTETSSGNMVQYICREFYCPGHPENVSANPCPGTHIEKTCNGHVDLLVSVTVDTYRQLFNDDYIGNTTGNVRPGASLGEFRITAYCACAACCGKSDGITATGTICKAGRTIAVDPDVIPYGTEVVINGHVYVAEDCGGGIDGKSIDLYFDSHEDALRWGVKYFEVYYPELDESGEYMADEESGQEPQLPDEAIVFSGWTEDEIDWVMCLYEDMDWQEMYGVSLTENTIIDAGLLPSIGDIEYPQNGMNIPLYLQYDPAWGGIPYGGGTISSSACGPTCMAMVISYLSGSTVTPASVASWAGNTFYVQDEGTSWDFYPAVAREWNLLCENLGKNTGAVVQALSQGKPVIVSVGPGTFTSSGHFIVLRGITADGYVFVNDPNDNTYSKNFKSQKFSFNLIVSQAKNFWSFSR